MKAARTLLMLAALAAAAAGCGRADVPAGALDAAALEARAAVEAYAAAVSSLDLDSASSFYTASGDFQWVEEGAIRYRSAREARESLAALAGAASSTGLALSDLTVTALAPDAAVATSLFEMDVGMDGGASFAFSGAMTIVLRREAGRWAFVSGHTSSEPGAGAAAAESGEGAATAPEGPP